MLGRRAAISPSWPNGAKFSDRYFLESSEFSYLGGGDKGDRTPDLVNAIHALSQLSYIPKLFAEARVFYRRRRSMSSAAISCRAARRRGSCTPRDRRRGRGRSRRGART